VVSTDSIRHMMRSFVDEKQNPLLWASTYHAGEYLDPVAVAESKARRRRAKKMDSIEDEKAKASEGGKAKNTQQTDVGSTKNTPVLLSPKQMAVEGFKAQSEMVIDNLDRLITAWEERKESVIVEGVHLSLNFVVRLNLFSLTHFILKVVILTSNLFSDGTDEKASFYSSFHGIHRKRGETFGTICS